MTTAKIEAIEESIEFLLQSLDEEVESKILSRHKQNLVDIFTARENTEIEEAAARSFLNDINMGDILPIILGDALTLAIDGDMSVYVWEIFLEEAIVEEVINLYELEEQESILDAYPEIFAMNDIVKDYAEKIGLEIA